MIVAAVDNDILIKGSAYELLHKMLSVVSADINKIGILGAAQYVVPQRLKKMALRKANSRVVRSFNSILNQVSIFEPTEEESRLAAEIEFHAKRLQLPLDAGESQLVAILVHRSLQLLATGDKRAIKAMEALRGLVVDINIVRENILCLEQIIKRLFKVIDICIIRNHICHEPGVDRTLTICFSCKTQNSTPQQWETGLNSYIGDLRRNAPILLSPS